MARDEQEKKESEWDNKKTINYHAFSRKTASRKRHTERQLKNRKKAQMKRENEDWMEASVENDRGSQWQFKVPIHRKFPHSYFRL